MKKILLFSVLVLALVAAGCGSSPPATDSATVVIESSPPPSSSNMDVSPMRSTIRDWNNRNMGEDQFPGWLRMLIVNRQQGPVRQAFGLQENTVIKVSQAERPNREEARVLADLMFAQQVATELKREVLTGAASNLNQGQMQLVEEITTATSITMTGGGKLADFWQLVETEDNGVISRRYVWYSVYSFQGELWSQLVAKYLHDVVGQIPDTRVQQQIASQFAEIDRQTRREEERTDAQFRQELELQVRAVDNLQEQEMARINQQTAQTAVIADAARAHADAEAAARWNAYRYGPPAAAAAAALTADDTDWVRALAVIAGVAF